jgi:hypothetical protein
VGAASIERLDAATGASQSSVVLPLDLIRGDADIAADGSIFLSGPCGGVIHLGTTTLDCTVDGTGFILKLDNANNVVWAKQLDQMSAAHAAAGPSGSSVYCVQYRYGGHDFGDGATAATGLIALASDGTKQWGHSATPNYAECGKPSVNSQGAVLSSLSRLENNLQIFDPTGKLLYETAPTPGGGLTAWDLVDGYWLTQEMNAKHFGPTNVLLHDESIPYMATYAYPGGAILHPYPGGGVVRAKPGEVLRLSPNGFRVASLATDSNEPVDASADQSGAIYVATTQYGGLTWAGSLLESFPSASVLVKVSP